MKLSVVAHFFNPSTPEAGAVGSLSQGRAGLLSKFQDKQKPCLKKQNRTTTTKKTATPQKS